MAAFTNKKKPEDVMQAVGIQPPQNTGGGGAGSEISPAKVPSDLNYKTSVEPTPTGVNYGVEGRNFTLTKDEYNALLTAQGGKTSGTGQFTDNVKNVLAAEEMARLKSQNLKGQRNAYLVQEAARQNLEDFTNIAQVPTLEQLDAASQPGKENNVLNNNEILPAQAISGLPITNTPEGKLEVGQASPFGIVPPSPALKSTAAQIIDVMRVGITGKKPLKTQQASAALDTAFNTLKANVDAVRNGASVYDSLDTIRNAKKSLNQLEASQKGFGKENLRYWSDNGWEIEAEIIDRQKQLDDLERALIQAANEARVNQQTLQLQQKLGNG